MRLVACLVLWCVAGVAFAQRPPREVPASPDAVIERLPAGYATLEPSQARRRPAIADAESLLATAARTGDARLAARADALLAAMPSHARVLRARAFSAQHRHDFDDAVRLLDADIQAHPRDGDARLSRAQIRLVQGRLDLARGDCVALALGIDAEGGLLCAASLALRRGDHVQAASLVDRLLAASPPAVLSRYLLVMRGEIASRAGDADADRWFRRALASDRDDVRTLAAYARHLRAGHRDADILALLADAPPTDALQLQRALAAHRLGVGQAAALVAAQGRRYATAHAAGARPELRDEAEYWLSLRDAPEPALALALENFDRQRDAEDVDVLLRAARAAGRPDARQAVLRWARAQGVRLPPGASR